MRRRIFALALVFLPFLAAAVQEPAEAGWRNRVYAMSDQKRNEIVVFDREADGSLSHFADFATGGKGIADATCPEDALGSQAPVIVSRNGRWVITTNPASNSLTVFRAGPAGLARVEKVRSGGQFPASLTLKRGVLYVLNSGGQGNITGFRFDRSDGSLTPIAGSTRGLAVNGDNPPFFLVSPAQVTFNPDGTLLAVTVKGDNTIRVYGMNADGTPSAAPVVNLSNGNTPFGFVFQRGGRLLVAEAFGNNPVGTGAAGAVSSYNIRTDGTINVISPSVDNFQTATCWLAAERRGRYAYTTNNVSGTISGYSIDRATGEIELLDPSGVMGIPGIGPNDFALSRGGRYLYVTNAGSGTVASFAVQDDGSLIKLGEVEGLPEEAGAVGLATR